MRITPILPNRVNASASLGKDHLSALPDVLIQTVFSFAPNEAIFRACKPIKANLPLANEWRNLRNSTINPDVHMDEQLRSFIENIENTTLNNNQKFEKLFYQICDHGGIAREIPPHLKEFSRYSLEFFQQLLIHAQTAQDTALYKMWSSCLREYFNLNPLVTLLIPAQNASANEIREFLNQDANVNAIQSFNSLVLASEFLGVIPREISIFTNLIHLVLVANEIENIPEGVLGELTNLNSLDLSNNQIIFRPNMFVGLINLECLFLANNCITDLPLMRSNN